MLNVRLLPKYYSKIAIVLSVFGAVQVAWANNFHGYYCPTIQISPMRDNVIYTPVGLGIVTSKAGFRIHPITGRGDFHSGVDLAANLNDRVYNLMDGFVTRVGWRGALGVAVEIYHPYPNVRTICGHLNAYSVVPGQWVRRGQVIGFAGTTGRSTGVHVHYTVIREDTKQYIEPLAFIGQVPKYVAALKKARAQSELAKNMQRHKEEKLAAKSIENEPDHKAETSDEDLPPSNAEVKPPAAEE